MLLKNLIRATAIAAVCMMVSPVTGQTSDSLSGDSTTLSAEGMLIGNVRTATADVVNNAKISLVSQGKVIDSVVSDESGSFSFSNVNPGPYQIVGSANGMVGAQAFHVGAFNETASAAPASVILQASAQESVYETVGTAPLAAYSNAPVAEYSSCSSCNTCNACNTCGGGVAGGTGFGGGGGFGGRLAGGIAGNRRLLLAGGLIGGIVAIAVDDDDDDDDDASPDF